MKNKENKYSKNEDGNKVPDQKRRDFMKVAWKGLGIIAGLEFSGLTLHYLMGRKQNKDDQELFEAGLPDEFPLGTVTPFRRGHFYLVRMDDGGFLAMSIHCSHLGCSIIWDENESEFICPCHSSRFSISGDVINPPAPRALNLFEITLTKGKLFVNLNKKIKRDGFDKSQLVYV